MLLSLTSLIAPIPAQMTTQGLIERLRRATMLLPLALLTLLLLGAFMVTARAEDTACGGRDVLADLKASDAARYEKVIAEGKAVRNGDHVFWKVEKDGLPTSYLLGTMHVTDPRVLTLPDAAAQARKSAKVIIIESDEILDEKKAAAAVFADPSLTMFTDKTTISSLIDSDSQKRLDEGLKARGLSLALVEKMKPWMIASFVSMPPCEFARKAKGASFLDKKIAEDAIADGQQVVGLETLKEQLTAMTEVPVTVHLEALIETLSLGSKIDDSIETMIRLYGQGQIGLIMPMLNAIGKDNSENAGYAAFEKRIILDRNKVMHDRSKAWFEKGGVFMAVGSLHLPGDEGVIEALRKDGYQVTPAL